ncbi:MAG: polysaccharide biosynthesis/export family protein [Hyphomicrobiales bacterium]|nr:polysaccharide biosynthesis/export family protein [Hyphomicrobiales bacterium]
MSGMWQIRLSSLPRRSQRWSHVATLLGALAFQFAHVLPTLADGAKEEDGYRLEPGDRINVSVFGQPELSGDLQIDGDGRITLPFIGLLLVKELTVPECQKLIVARLVDGYLNQPSVSVRVSEPRPLYIIGDVRVPGSHPFQYGMSAKGAVALAGGFGPSEPLQNSSLSEFLQADERLRQLNLQRQALLVRKARLEAQSQGLSTFSPPASSSSVEAKDIAELVAIEKDTLASQIANQKTLVDLMHSQKPRLEKEIEATNGQITTEKKELALAGQNADQYGKLVRQGLGLSNAEMQLRLSEANYESDIWRLEAQLSRLQMDSGDLDLKINEVESAFKKQTLTELADVRGRLKELEVTLPLAREIREVKLQQASSIGGIEPSHSISITRTQDGKASTFEASDTSMLEPGDVVEIKRLLSPEISQPDALLRQSNSNPQKLGAQKLGAAVNGTPVASAVASQLEH